MYSSPKSAVRLLNVADLTLCECRGSIGLQFTSEHLSRISLVCGALVGASHTFEGHWIDKHFDGVPFLLRIKAASVCIRRAAKEGWFVVTERDGLVNSLVFARMLIPESYRMRTNHDVS